MCSGGQSQQEIYDPDKNDVLIYPLLSSVFYRTFTINLSSQRPSVQVQLKKILIMFPFYFWNWVHNYCKLMVVLPLRHSPVQRCTVSVSECCVTLEGSWC